MKDEFTILARQNYELLEGLSAPLDEDDVVGICLHASGEKDFSLSIPWCGSIMAAYTVGSIEADMDEPAIIIDVDKETKTAIPTLWHNPIGNIEFCFLEHETANKDALMLECAKTLAVWLDNVAQKGYEMISMSVDECFKRHARYPDIIINLDIMPDNVFEDMEARDVEY